MSNENTADPAHFEDLTAQIFRTMEQRGLSMRRLAATAQLPYKTVQNYLSGRHRIPADALGKLAGALDVSTDWLLFGRPARFNKTALFDALEVVSDFRSFTRAGGEPMQEDEITILFEKYYAKFYQEHLGGASRTVDARDRAGGRRSRRTHE